MKPDNNAKSTNAEPEPKDKEAIDKLLPETKEAIARLAGKHNNLDKMDGLISSIRIDQANMKYCSDNHIINGTLYLEIKRVMESYSASQNKELRKENEELKEKVSAYVRADTLFESHMGKKAIDKLQSKIDENKDQLKYCHKRMAEAYNEITKLQSCLHSAEEELDNAKDEANDYKDSLTLLKQSNSELKKENEELRKSNNEMGLILLDRDGEIEQLKEDCAKLQSTIDEKNKEIERLNGLIEDAHNSGWRRGYSLHTEIGESLQQFKSDNNI